MDHHRSGQIQHLLASPGGVLAMAKGREELVKEIREGLKKAFPSLKWSVVMRDYNSMVVSLMEAPESPYLDGRQEGYNQLNHYHIKEECNGVKLAEWAVPVLQEANEIINLRNWDHSDLQSDFFDVNFYLQLQIGKWDHHFKVKE